MDLTKPPIPVFRRLPQPYHLRDSIECLVALATGDGDARDCNKAAEELVDTLTEMFDAVVEYVADLPEFVDLTPKERDDFIYYAIMERQGHGVGLTCDPGRFPEKAVDLARDAGTDLYARVGAVVRWIEQNLDDGGMYAIKGNLVIEVAVYTTDSTENSESAASIFPVGVGINDVLDDVVGFAEDCETTDEAAEEETSDISLGLFLFTLETVLDEYPVEISDVSCCVSLGTQALLSRQSYRRLPFMRADRGDEESDEDYNSRAEIIGVDVSWWFEKGTLTTDHNGPTEQVKWLNENPEGLVDDLVRSTDWYYKQYTAAKAAAKEVEEAATEAAEGQP
jgi:hypothetical protein